MKRLILLACAGLLTACAHERTEIDREALLKVIDNAKPLPQQAPIIVTTPAPTVNVNFNGGVSPQGVAPVKGQQTSNWRDSILPETTPPRKSYISDPEEREQEKTFSTVDGHHCTSAPIHSYGGAYAYTDTNCW